MTTVDKKIIEEKILQLAACAEATRLAANELESKLRLKRAVQDRLESQIRTLKLWKTVSEDVARIP